MGKRAMAFPPGGVYTERSASKKGLTLSYAKNKQASDGELPRC